MNSVHKEGKKFMLVYFYSLPSNVCFMKETTYQLINISFSVGALCSLLQLNGWVTRMTSVLREINLRSRYVEDTHRWKIIHIRTNTFIPAVYDGFKDNVYTVNTQTTWYLYTNGLTRSSKPRIVFYSYDIQLQRINLKLPTNWGTYLPVYEEWMV